MTGEPEDDENPEETEANQEYLTNAWKQVRMSKAKHEWDTAQYYDRRKEYAAARESYRRVRDSFQDISLAQDASKRLEAIAENRRSRVNRCPGSPACSPQPTAKSPCSPLAHCKS